MSNRKNEFGGLVKMPKWKLSRRDQVPINQYLELLREYIKPVIDEIDLKPYYTGIALEDGRIILVERNQGGIVKVIIEDEEDKLTLYFFDNSKCSKEYKENIDRERDIEREVYYENSHEFDPDILNFHGRQVIEVIHRGIKIVKDNFSVSWGKLSISDSGRPININFKQDISLSKNRKAVRVHHLTHIGEYNAKWFKIEPHGLIMWDKNEDYYGITVRDAARLQWLNLCQRLKDIKEYELKAIKENIEKFNKEQTGYYEMHSR